MLDSVRATHTILQQRTTSNTPATLSAPSAPRQLSIASACLVTLSLFTGPLLAAETAGTAPTELNISASELADALSKFGALTGMQVVYAPELARGLKAPAVSGRLTADAALERLLAGTGLTWRYVNGNTVVLERAAGAQPPSAAPRKETETINRHPEPDQTTVVGKGIPEVLVEGSKSLNMDIERTRDDVQPYVVLDRSIIERSGASNIDDLLKQRLTMNTVSASQSQQASATGNLSSINLRGLGANQTLILIDGHRAASYGAAGSMQQPDLNGIPLAAIERIEILPATASGIYGGSATGGVVNVVLRKDYSGVQLRLTYEDALDSGQANRRVDLSAGFDLEGGRTNVMIAGSHSDASPFQVSDRDFVERGRANLARNNPAAIYGVTTPPLGTTTNIRSATLVGGVPQNLTLKSGAALDSPITFVPEGYGGPSTDGGAALVANAGRYNLGLANTAQNVGGGRQSLLNESRVETITAMVRREFTSRIDGFLQVDASNNSGSFIASGATSTFVIPSTAAHNPFNQDIRVTTPAIGADSEVESTNYTRRAVAGVVLRLSDNWRAETDYTWNRTRYYSYLPGDFTTAAAAAVRSGSIDVLRDVNAFETDFSPFIGQATVLSPVHTTLRDMTLRLAGSAWDLPGGPLAISALLETRKESLDDQVQITATSQTLSPSRSQSVDSAYVELKVPVFSANNTVPMVEELEFQLAARHDRYTTRGAGNVPVGSTTPVVRATNTVDSTDPTFGVRYKPVRDITLRGSYGTGFLPPNVSQLAPGAPLPITAPTAALLGLTDPRRGGQPLGAFSVATGGNPDLEPEQSKSWSAGLVFTPRWVPDLRLSVDWIKIEKTGNITFFPLTNENIARESSIPGLVTRAPVQPGDPFGVGPIIGFNNAFLNVASAEVSAYDFAADYQFRAGDFGTFRFSAVATRQISNETQTVPTVRVVENAGLITSLKWKGNATLEWSYRDWTAGWSTRYFDGYWLNAAHTVVANQGSAEVPSQIYHDIFGSYRRGGGERDGALLSDIEVRLGVRNVFDKSPPYDSVAFATSRYFYSPLGDPRKASYYVSLTKSF